MKRKTSRTRSNRKATPKKASGQRTAKRQNIIAIAAEIEKEFFSLPAKLVALCRKEQGTLRQDELRLKASLKAATAKQQQATKKLADLKNAKRPASRTRINSAKKLIAACNSVVTQIRRDLKTAQTAYDGVAKKQAGFALLAKDLPKLRKEMLAAARKTTRKKPARPKKNLSKEARPLYSAMDEMSHQDIPAISTRVDPAEIT